MAIQRLFRSTAEAGLGSSSSVVQLGALRICQQWLAVATPALSGFACDVLDGVVPCWRCTSGVLFNCESRIGLCCVFVVFPGCIPLVSAINRGVHAYRWGNVVGQATCKHIMMHVASIT